MDPISVDRTDHKFRFVVASDIDVCLFAISLQNTKIKYDLEEPMVFTYVHIGYSKHFVGILLASWKHPGHFVRFSQPHIQSDSSHPIQVCIQNGVPLVSTVRLVRSSRREHHEYLKALL